MNGAWCARLDLLSPSSQQLLATRQLERGCDQRENVGRCHLGQCRPACKETLDEQTPRIGVPSHIPSGLDNRSSNIWFASLPQTEDGARVSKDFSSTRNSRSLPAVSFPEVGPTVCQSPTMACRVHDAAKAFPAIPLRWCMGC